MAEMLLVNPRRRRRKMSALQRRYFGGGRRHKRRARVATRVTTLVRNPRRRHRRRGYRVTHLRRNPLRIRERARARFMRLSGFRVMPFIRDLVVPGVIGGVGALAVDVGVGYVGPSLPSFLQSGIGLVATKIAGVVALGMLAGMATSRGVGEKIMAGGITVVLYNYMRTQLAASAPGLTLGGRIGYAGPARAFPDALGLYVDAGRGVVSPSVVASAGTVAPQVSRRRRGGVGEYVSGYETNYMY